MLQAHSLQTMLLIPSFSFPDRSFSFHFVCLNRYNLEDILWNLIGFFFFEWIFWIFVYHHLLTKDSDLQTSILSCNILHLNIIRSCLQVCIQLLQRATQHCVFLLLAEGPQEQESRLILFYSFRSPRKTPIYFRKALTLAVYWLNYWKYQYSLI